MLKKINKEIKKLEQQKQQKIDKKNYLESQVHILNCQLKDLNSLKTQYEKLEQNTDSVFQKMKNGDSDNEI